MKKISRRLELILDYGNKAQLFLENKSIVDWQHDEQLRFAVAHALAGVAENVKEYIQSVGVQTRIQAYPTIPWTHIARFRDKMVHHYESMDQDVLFEFATIDLVELLAIIQKEVKKENISSGQGFSYHKG
ncbi:MAG: HepT-like ribonuclease domain-containing protein [Pseudomonadota bacterium]